MIPRAAFTLHTHRRSDVPSFHLSVSVFFLMSATVCITWLQWISGIIGLVVLIPYSALPSASKNVDHPSRYWRLFFRVMAVLACNSRKG